ncbi:MAG TPA: hypothetical protein VME86_07800 [Acidobacteriaceae bacterium]|nr:hypothetical protein [Acidobacteriaceae bacterium]
MTNAINKLLVLSFLFTATVAYSQVARSVNGGESTLWVGGEFSAVAPDYGSHRLIGLGTTVDLNVTPKIGVIGEARWLHFHNSDDGNETQSDYLAGAKYRLFRWQKFDFDAKFLVGGVWIRFPGDIGSGSYFAYAPGAFVDYRLMSRLRIRGGYEWQMLPSAPNIPGQPNNGLTPHGFMIGVTYAILR